VSQDKQVASRLHRGDLVIVRPANEILRTLDSEGTLDGLPVMPEMLAVCGQTFRVLQNVVQACVDGAFLKVHTESYVREFRNNNVVTLEGVRCSGVDHGGCQRGCAISWKEAWLRKVGPGFEDTETHTNPNNAVAVRPDLRLKTKTESGGYYCQGSEFLKATLHLSFGQRIGKCFEAVAVQNLSAAGMAKRILVWTWWKVRRQLMGEHAKRAQTKTPTESMNLQPGELIEVKSFEEIVATLDNKGCNRGLHFSGDQRPFCGGRYRVRSAASRFIGDGSGEMGHFRNTVILEDVLCDSAYYSFGGCYRSEFLYWREIWLKRIEG
jgi:hypothetical protein